MFELTSRPAALDRFKLSLKSSSDLIAGGSLRRESPNTRSELLLDGNCLPLEIFPRLLRNSNRLMGDFLFWEVYGKCCWSSSGYGSGIAGDLELTESNRSKGNLYNAFRARFRRSFTRQSNPRLCNRIFLLDLLA